MRLTSNSDFSLNEMAAFIAEMRPGQMYGSGGLRGKALATLVEFVGDLLVEFAGDGVEKQADRRGQEGQSSEDAGGELNSQLRVCCLHLGVGDEAKEGEQPTRDRSAQRHTHQFLRKRTGDLDRVIGPAHPRMIGEAFHNSGIEA